MEVQGGRNVYNIAWVAFKGAATHTGSTRTVKYRKDDLVGEEV